MKTRDLTQGNILNLILVVAVPTIISGLMQFTYNIVDMFFVGQYGGSTAIASIGTASLYIGLGMSINFLAITGVGIKISHAVGSGDNELAKKYMNAGLALNAILATITFVVFFFGADIMIKSMGVNDSVVYSQSVTYTRIYGVVFLFSFFNTQFTRVMSSVGKSDSALKINTVGTVTNVILDPILIFVLGLGVAGAGIATLVANIIIFVLFIVKNRDIFVFNKAIGVSKDCVKEITKLGMPYTFQRLFFTFIGIATGRAMIGFGEEVIAGQRLGFQIETVTLLVVGGLMSAVSAFTGQNFGAKQYDRIKKGFNIAIAIGIGYTIITSSIFIFFADNIASWFVDDELTIQYVVMYLQLIALSQAFAVLEMVGNGLYTGIGKPKIPTVISVTITPLRLVFAYALAPVYGPIALYVGIIFTSVLKGAVSYGYYIFKIKKQIGTTIVSEKK